RRDPRPSALATPPAYTASRITTAGGVPARLFTRDAVTLVHEYSNGIARTINVICDNALVTGMALGRQPADGRIVVEVCRDLALRKNATVPAAASVPTGDTRPVAR